MRKVTIVLGMLITGLYAGEAASQAYSTSALQPTAIPASGVLSANYPAGDAETTFYFSSNLKAGSLLAQIGFKGRPSADKALEFELVDPAGHRVSSFFIMSSLDANQTAARSLPIDTSGTYSLRVKTKGPETTSYSVELGGSAFPQKQVSTAPAGLSNSYLSPSNVGADGTISGSFPGGDRVVTSYYLATDLKAGDLLTQISFNGRSNVPKQLELTLLDGNGKRAASYYIMNELDANQTATKSFPIDSTGRHVFQISVAGAEGTKFKVELGGSAFVTQ